MPVRRIENIPFPDPRASLEKILRPLEEYRQRRDQALAKLREPPVEEETRFCWGGPGRFTFDDIPDTGVSFTTKNPGDKKDRNNTNDLDPGEGGPDDGDGEGDGEGEDGDDDGTGGGTTTTGKVLTWTEQARITKDVRVENPDDPSQYLIVERIESIFFKPPGEDIASWPHYPHRFELKNPAPKSKNPPRSAPVRTVPPPPEP